MSFGLRADSHQPRLYSKLTFEGATPCTLKISQPSHPCQGLPPVDTPHGVCRDYILQPCRPGAHECSLPLAGRVQEGQDVQSLLLSKLGCLRSRPHIIIPACPAGNSRKHHALLHEQVSPRSSQKLLIVPKYHLLVTRGDLGALMAESPETVNPGQCYR